MARLAQTLDSAAGPLLIGVSVYREPADRNALLFQVGRHDWAAWDADGQGPMPPYQAPPDLAVLIAGCAAKGLITVCGDQPDPPVFVERPLAGELARMLEEANRARDLARAHRRAAEYWRWRAIAWPQQRRADLHDLLEARHHLRQAGRTAQACELTEALCSRLHAWGELGREAALIGDTLAWLPERSARRAAWLRRLGTIAQVNGDHAEAERRYQEALDCYAAAGDPAGVSRCHHSLGVLAQAQGDYVRAELRYQQCADAVHGRRSRAALPPPPPAAVPALLPPTAPQPADPLPAAFLPAIPAPAAPPDSAPPVIAQPAPLPAVPTPAPPVIAQPAAPTPAIPPSAAPLPPVPTPPVPVPAVALPPVAPPVQVPAVAPGGEQGAGSDPSGRSGRLRLAGLVGLATALFALSVTEIPGVAGSGLRAWPAQPGATTPRSSAAAEARRQAAGWVARQVSHSTIVACDPAMCAQLQRRGFPAGDLLMLGRGPAGPLGSDVVVATAALRARFGARLAGEYAPLVLATFGAGGASVAVRAIAPDGLAAFRDALAADVAARRQAGIELLSNPGISAAAGAHRQLSGGAVDSRLLITLAALAGQRSAGQPPIRIISFGGPGPGASAQAPLRSVEIAGPVPGTTIAFLRAQHPPYLAAHVAEVRLSGGQAAVRIGFSSPSPLGLLTTVSPAAGAVPPP